MDVMKIISWNVNGLRAVERKGALEEFLTMYRPDILLLQEIKGNAEQFSADLTDHEAYQQYYHSAQKAGYAGTGVWVTRKFSRQCDAVTFHTDVPHLVNADEGRVAHLQFTHVGTVYDVLSIYFPNGGKSIQAWKEKLLFYDGVLDYMNTLHAQGHVVIVGGDMNVAHQPIDLARPKDNDGKIGFHPDERAWMDRVIAAGWIDTWRMMHPEEVKYSWWNVVTRARERNVGWRIDYIFVHRDYQDHVRVSDILTDVMGSDHCPVSIEYAL